jgi:hypothetical protein
MSDNVKQPAPEMLNPMVYHAPNAEQARHHETISLAATSMYDAVLDNCPQSAERTLAIRKLQEARMWANAAIAFDGRTYPL